MRELTVNGRVYTKRGARWTYEPKNNHGRKEVDRRGRLHHALEELANVLALIDATRALRALDGAK